MRFAVLTVSDRVSRGEAEDKSGPALQQMISERNSETVKHLVVADNTKSITETLRTWCDSLDFDVVVTTGGTGLSERDVTPEATRAVINYEVPGLAELMRRQGEEQTPLAALSRQVCGVRNGCLIINVPGSPRAAVHGLTTVFPLLDHALSTMRGSGH